MKRFLKGFTLAEVLVTLTIVGVIASITLPSLNINAQKQQIGPALAKAINTLESATRMALQQEQARRLSDIPPANTENPDLFRDILGPYMNLTPVSSWPHYSNISSYGQNPFTDPVFQTPDGIIYNKKTSLINNRYLVFVDINGLKGPNSGGRDLFALLVYNDGEVIALGSKEHTKRAPGNVNIHETNCSKANGIVNWMTCGGSIVDNNYQVTYY